VKILDRLAYLVVFLVILLGVLGIFFPLLLPILNKFSYASIMAMGYLIPRSCYQLVLAKTVRTGAALVSFSLLYLSVVIGFASAYYLIQGDFVHKDVAGRDAPDVEIEELIAKWEKLTSEIPAEDEQAWGEYEKWKELESKISSLQTMIGKIWARKLRPQEEGSPKIWRFPDDPQPFVEQVEALRTKQKTLDSRLIAKHQDRLVAIALANDAQEKVARYSYLNFVYFSTVTVATVGYGDITPNRLRAKMLVTIQILLGAALILVFLSLALRSP
jgi:hypothetical protein